MHGPYEYFSWAERINRLYCERHGYEYVISREEPRGDRHICWHKIPAISGELHDCDYLLYLDADAVFYSHELKIENELIPELQGKSILMAQDCVSESLRWSQGLPNSGVILLKTGRIAVDFMADWDHVSEIDEETRWRWPPEQLALWRHVMPKYGNDIRVVVDYYIVQGLLGQYIRHFCLCSDAKRTQNMKTIHDRLKIKQKTNWPQSRSGSENHERYPEDKSSTISLGRT